jgi:hypothetical protein
VNKSTKKDSSEAQDAGKPAVSPGEAAGKSPAAPYKKKLLQLADARAVCGCDEDTMLAAAGDGEIAAFVIAQGWAAENAPEPVWGYVQVKPQVVMLIRGADYLPITEGKLDGRGPTLKFVETQRLPRGALHFSAGDAQRFAANNPRPIFTNAPAAAAPAKPGPQAERNLERTVAAMALLLAKTDPARFMDNGKPNAKAIAEAAAETLDAAQLADSGLSVRAIQDRILTGWKVLSI